MFYRTINSSPITVDYLVDRKTIFHKSGNCPAWLRDSQSYSHRKQIEKASSWRDDASDGDRWLLHRRFPCPCRCRFPCQRTLVLDGYHVKQVYVIDCGALKVDKLLMKISYIGSFAQVPLGVFNWEKNSPSQGKGWDLVLSALNTR